MKIKPDDKWRWYFDYDLDRLMLDLANGMVFRSSSSAKMLIPDAFVATPFCVEDASLYYMYQDKCHHLGLNSAQQAELTLNALVAFRFLKPQMPKSWHFLPQHSNYHIQQADLVSVCLTDRNEDANLLIVESGSNASLCVVAQPKLELSNREVFLGHPIKIMNDRLSPFVIKAIAAPDFARAV